MKKIKISPSILSADFSQLSSEIKKLEHELRKGRAQRRMAAWTLFAMALYTAALFMPFVSDNRVEQLIRVSDLFYISGAGIVAAFFGTNAWIQRK